MLRILLVLVAVIAFGILLASGSSSWPMRPGYVGFGALVLSAWMVGRYWHGLPPEGSRPGFSERALLHGLASYGLLLGHLSATLWHLGPQFDMHTIAGHALALDNWTLVLGAIVSYWIARDPEPRRDERDGLIRARGLEAGFGALMILLITTILLLGFANDTAFGRFSQPMLAHVLILIVLIQCLVQVVTQLRLYWLDALAERNAQ